jgi:DNA sulfur modification protein DndB
MGTISAPFIEFFGIKGKQAGKANFVSAWSISMIVRLLGTEINNKLTDPATKVDQKFVDELIGRLENPEFSLGLSPLVVGVYGPIEFFEHQAFTGYGKIRMSIDAEFKILDGQHRLIALSKARLPQSRLDSEEIPVLLIQPLSERQIQNAEIFFQNYHQEQLKTKSTKSILSKETKEITKDLIRHSPFLRRSVELEASCLSSRSRKLITLSALSKASTPMFQVLAELKIEGSDLIIAEYWDYLRTILKPWKNYFDKRLSAAEVRNTSVLSSAVVLVALGNLGAQLFKGNLENWKIKLTELANLDWDKKPSSIWEGRVLEKGRFLMGKKSELLASNLMKQACGFELKDEEMAIELCLQQTSHGDKSNES